MLVGEITHFYTKAIVALVEVSDTLRVGDEIVIQGSTTNFTQKVESMQIEHESIEQANAGDSIGLKVNEMVRKGDHIYIELV